MIHRKPKVGDVIERWNGQKLEWERFGVVIEVAKRIAHVETRHGEHDSFIYQFARGYWNHLHRFSGDRT